MPNVGLIDGTINQVSSEGTISSISWNMVSGSAPTGSNAKYKWVRIGNIVTLWWRIESTPAVGTVNFARFSLPADCPTPSILSNQNNDEFVTTGTSAGGSALNSWTVSGTGFLRTPAGAYDILSGASSTNGTLVMGCLSYFV